MKHIKSIEEIKKIAVKNMVRCEMENIIKDEENFSRFLTSRYNRSNAKKINNITATAFSKKDIESKFTFEKLIKEIVNKNFEVYNGLAADKDIYVLRKENENRIIKDYSIFKIVEFVKTIKQTKNEQ